MVSEAQDNLSVIEAYKEQFARARHLDRMALTTFTIIAVLTLVLYAFLGLEIWIDDSSQLAIGLLSLGLAAAGVHITAANAGDYWVTFVVLAQLTRGLGLVRRGLFPASLLARAPVGRWNFISSLLGGFRGPLLLVYLIIGWHSTFLMFMLSLEPRPAFALAIPIPLLLAAGSTMFGYERVKRRLVALRQHDELVEATRDNVVDSHCDLAEALLWLDPPRLFHAQRQYEMALEIEPDNPRANEGLQKVLAWRGKRPPPDSNAPADTTEQNKFG